MFTMSTLLHSCIYNIKHDDLFLGKPLDIFPENLNASPRWSVEKHQDTKELSLTVSKSDRPLRHSLYSSVFAIRELEEELFLK